jgi:hypothetical protein
MGLFPRCLTRAPGVLRPRDSASEVAGAMRRVIRSVTASPVLEADTRGCSSLIQGAAVEPHSTRMSSTCRRHMGGARAVRDHRDVAGRLRAPLHGPNSLTLSPMIATGSPVWLIP